MKNINIGITINIKESENIWNNGIVQNVINFALLLKNSPNDYNIFVINTSKHNKLEYNIEGINIYPIEDVYKNLDLIFILGSQITDQHYYYLKGKGAKVVYYSCGTNYILDMQQILYNKETTKKIYPHVPDEIWLIPQNYKTNKYYHETVYKRNAIEIPFIWSSTFIDFASKSYKTNFNYVPTNEPKRISCFEPNIDVVKFAMYNILIVEQAYNDRPDLIKHFYITNADKIKVNPLFINIMNKLDVVKNKIATFEGRYKMPYFLEKYTDIVVAYQWENPLNYAYLDALYLNYPIVHNAHIIKDGGYYYKDFNVKQGKEKLLYALTEHDKNIEEYNENNKKVLDRYLPTNEKSINIYDKLIDKLFKK